MAVAVKKPMTVDEYLAWAETRPEGERYELVDGEVVAMAPERNRHNLVKTNAVVALRLAVREAGAPCVVLGDGATVVIDETTAFEPDAVVQCGAPLDPDAVTADAPTIVVEVISPSSQGIDTNRKLDGYFRLPSVRHYLVVDPVRRTVLHYARGEEGRIETTRLVEGRLRLEPQGLALEVADLFASLS
jgi:Uma2 family endonuclease